MRHAGANFPDLVAGLIKDLKQRGLLEETLILWGGEFGRTPDNNKRGGVYSLGRGHNNMAMTMLMAGGGMRTGQVIGATDQTGAYTTDPGWHRDREARIEDVEARSPSTIRQDVACTTFSSTNSRPSRAFARPKL